MATLDVTDVVAISFQEDVTVTAPDGNTYLALSGERLGVPDSNRKSGSMTVSIATDVRCMINGSEHERTHDVIACFTVDAVRASA